MAGSKKQAANDANFKYNSHNTVHTKAIRKNDSAGSLSKGMQKNSQKSQEREPAGYDDWSGNTSNAGRGGDSGSLLIGRNSVGEALRSGRPIDTVYISRGALKGSLSVLAAKAKAAGAAVKETDPRRLDSLCGGGSHQGIAAIAAVKGYVSLEELFQKAEERGEPPFFLIADGLEDPHNLGAILRTAECAGAHGIILPERRSVGLTWAVGKASAGAVEYVPVCRVHNLSFAIEELKKRGVWIYAADMGGEPWCAAQLTGPLALVIGSEGFGVSRLVRERCDFVLSLPMKGHINSLNASVACGIICYEIARQRAGLPKI